MFSGLTKELNSWLPVIKKDTELSLDEKQESTDENKKNDDSTDEKPSENKEESVLKKVAEKNMFSGLTKELNNWLPSMKKDTPADKEKSSNEKDGNDDDSKDKEPAANQEDATSPVSPMIDMVTSWFGTKDKDDTKTETSPSGEEGEEPSTVKNISNMLYSAVNKAGQSFTEAGAKIKKSVEENSILGEFNKEQESFIREKNSNQNRTYATLPPWVGHPNEDQLKAACLELSKDKKNFTRDPPPGVEFEFDYTTQYPVAMVTLAQDKQLERMRFELVPASLTEEKFWRNYFYRVSLITQANELSSLEAEHLHSQVAASDPAPDHEADSSPSTLNSPSQRVLDNSAAQDFVSDTVTTNHNDLDEIREEMKKLGLECNTTNSNTTEEDWEKELDAEINEFEVVPQDDASDAQWNDQLESTLDSMDSAS